MHDPLPRADGQSGLGTLAVEDADPPDTAYTSSEASDAVEQTDGQQRIRAVLRRYPVENGDMDDRNRIRRIAQIECKAEKFSVRCFVGQEEKGLRVGPLGETDAEMVLLPNDLWRAVLIEQFHDAAS